MLRATVTASEQGSGAVAELRVFRLAVELLDEILERVADSPGLVTQLWLSDRGAAHVLSTMLKGVVHVKGLLFGELDLHRHSLS